MRLINAHTLDLEEFLGEDVPEYAILSHTWGKEEVSFQEWTMLARSRKLKKRGITELSEVLFDFLDVPSIAQKSGYAKTVACCEQAKRDGLTYAWVDTCCIDKTSSAELSEAINSMYRWYQDSKICYVYLADVPAAVGRDEDRAALGKSRWFSRGWTLQEFLAPAVVAFFDAGWRFIAFKADMIEPLAAITGIRSLYLNKTFDVRHASVAQRMSWAARRQTTRKEDMAYSLLGIFDVHMPLLYGEGHKAFARLQEEIVKQCEDVSYLAWGFRMPLTRDFHGIFARSPADFTGCADVVNFPEVTPMPAQMTSKGLQISLRVWIFGYPQACYAILNCGVGNTEWLALPLHYSSIWSAEDGSEVWRVPGGTPVLIKIIRNMSQHDVVKKRLVVFIRREPYYGNDRRSGDDQRSLGFEIRGTGLGNPEIPLFEAYPPFAWSPSRRVFTALAGPYKASFWNRLFLRFAPNHGPSDEKNWALVALEFEGSRMPQFPHFYGDIKPSGIRTRVIRADEFNGELVSPDMGWEFSSLADVIMAEPSWASCDRKDPLYSSQGADEVFDYILSAKVQEGDPWIINVNISRKEGQLLGTLRNDHPSLPRHIATYQPITAKLGGTQSVSQRTRRRKPTQKRAQRGTLSRSGANRMSLSLRSLQSDDMHGSARPAAIKEHGQ